MKPARNCIPRWVREESTPHQPPAQSSSSVHPHARIPSALTTAAQPCRMPAAPLAPVRAERCSSVRAWLRRGAPIAVVCESDRSLGNFVGICQRCIADHWGEASLVERQHEVSLVARQFGRPRLVADVARLAGRARVGSAALGSSMAASGAALSACRGTRPFLRCHLQRTPSQ